MRLIPSSCQLWRDKRGRLSSLRIATLLLLLFPLAKALVDFQAIYDGARPVNDLIHRAGFWALIFLGVTLAVTPFRSIARYGQLVDVRRMLGVGTFCYIAAHLLLYIDDQMFDLGKVAYEITHRWYLIVGGTAWLGLGGAGDHLNRRHDAPARRHALAAAAHDRLRHRAARAHPLFPADQGRRHRAGVRRRPVRLAHRLPRAGVVAGQAAAFDVQPVRPHASWSQALTFFGEAIGIGIAFHVSPMVVLGAAFDLQAGIRPGWEVLAAGLAVVALDFVRSRFNSRSARTRSRAPAVAAE